MLFAASVLYGQGEIDDQPTIALRNERTFAFILSSNSFGFNFSYAQRRDGYRKRLYSVSAFNLKSDKEIKVVNQQFSSQNRFVYGKANFVLNLRGGFGMQKEVFSKRDKGSINIRYFYTFGPSLAVLKPIYYEVAYIQTPHITIFKDEKFDPDNPHHQQYSIAGRSPFVKGMNELNISPGANLKFGFEFEYSKQDERIRSLEAGVTADVFLLPIQIMATQDPQYLFYGFFISYRFGKVLKAKTLRG